MTKKLISFRIEDKLIDKIEQLKEPKTDIINNALKMYLESINKSEKNPKIQINTIDNKNTKDLDKQINNKNYLSNLQITQNYDIIEYLKRDHEWLKDRIEHFEHTQDIIIEKIKIINKIEKQKTWFRM